MAFLQVKAKLNSLSPPVSCFMTSFDGQQEELSFCYLTATSSSCYTSNVNANGVFTIDSEPRKHHQKTNLAQIHFSICGLRAPYRIR